MGRGIHIFPDDLMLGGHLEYTPGCTLGDQGITVRQALGAADIGTVALIRGVRERVSWRTLSPQRATLLPCPPPDEFLAKLKFVGILKKKIFFFEGGWGKISGGTPSPQRATLLPCPPPSDEYSISNIQ